MTYWHSEPDPNGGIMEFYVKLFRDSNRSSLFGRPVIDSVKFGNWGIAGEIIHLSGDVEALIYVMQDSLGHPYWRQVETNTIGQMKKVATIDYTQHGRVSLCQWSF